MLEVHQIHPLRLNIGAGDKRVEGWVSIDLDPAADIVADACDIPLPDACADAVMSIHSLEHIEPWRAEAALKEWQRLLKPGGRLAIEMPDLLKCCRNVLERRCDTDSMHGLYGDPRYRNSLMLHKWLYSEAQVIAILQGLGFRKVKGKPPEWHGRRVHRDMRVEARK